MGLHLTDKQNEILQATVDHDRVAVKAGRKVGKSFLAAALALWWPIRYPDGKVILTATADRQVREILWGDINRIVIKSSARPGLKDFWPNVPKLPHSGMRWPDGQRSIIGYTTARAEGGAGMSGEHQLYIVDEASGVEDRAFEAILGNMAGGGTLFMISNPTQPGGFFYEAFHSKSHLWKTYSISSLESPCVTAGKALKEFAGMATVEWIDEMAEAWGRGTALYQCHVEGEFPTQADDCVIPLGDVTAACVRYREHCDSHGRLQWDDDDGPLELGVDPAYFGDDECVIAARRGRKLIELVPFKNLDGGALAAKTVRICNDLRRGEIDGRPLVKVDNVGIGASAFDFLVREQSVRAVGVKASERAVDAERYANKRAELWHTLAKWIRDGGCIPADEKLKADLAAPRYDYSDPKGRMRVEEKPSYKRRLGRSPDRADALALAAYDLCGGPLCLVPHDHTAAAHRRADGGYRLSGGARGFG